MRIVPAENCDEPQDDQDAECDFLAARQPQKQCREHQQAICRPGKSPPSPDKKRIADGDHGHRVGEYEVLTQYPQWMSSPKTHRGTQELRQDTGIRQQCQYQGNDSWPAIHGVTPVRNPLTHTLRTCHCRPKATVRDTCNPRSSGRPPTTNRFPHTGLRAWYLVCSRWCERSLSGWPRNSR